MKNWNPSFQLPDTFRVVQAGFVPGRQTVNRAELLAVYYAILCYPKAQTLRIFRDSQYVVKLLPLILEKPDARAHWHRDNFDWVSRICVAVQATSTEISILKIKSHQDIVDLPTLLEKYRAIGNHCADAAAACLRRMGNPCVRELRQALTVSWKHREQFTRLALEYLADIQKEKISQIREQPILSSQQGELPTSSGQTRRERQLNVLTIRVTQPINWLIADLPEHLFDLCLYGVTYMKRLIAWARSLIWGPPNKDCLGVTWFELYVNFRIVTQSEIPTNLSKDSKKPKYYTPEQNSDVLLLKLSEKAIRRLWVDSMRTVSHLLRRPLFPYSEASCVRSLQKILPTDYGSGLSQRPEMLRSLETAATVQKAVLSTCKPGRFGGAGAPDVPKLIPLAHVPMPITELPDVAAALKLRAWKKMQVSLAPLACTQSD